MPSLLRLDYRDVHRRAVSAASIPGFLTGSAETTKGDRVGGLPSERVRTRRQWNESPHAQLPCAFGLSIVKPCFWIVSSKSMDAPSRYGTLILSTTTSTPEK